MRSLCLLLLCIAVFALLSSSPVDAKKCNKRAFTRCIEPCLDKKRCHNIKDVPKFRQCLEGCAKKCVKKYKGCSMPTTECTHLSMEVCSRKCVKGKCKDIKKKSKKRACFKKQARGCVDGCAAKFGCKKKGSKTRGNNKDEL